MKILIASSIDPGALERLRLTHDLRLALGATEEVLRAEIAGQDVLIFRSGVSISGPVLAAADRLKLIIRAGSGLDNIDLDELDRRGIRLERIPRPSAQAVAELAFAHMLCLARQVPRADALLRQGRWTKGELEGSLLHGKTLGVVGAGNIGGRVCELGLAWGMRVIACVEHATSARAREFKELGVELTSFEDLVPQADFLSVHVPLCESTQHLIGRDVLARMKPGSFLINTSRGGVVDEAALLEALTRGDRVRGAGLDVHEHEGPGMRSPLADLPNVVLTPHVGASTTDTQRDIGREIVAILEAFEAAGPRA